MGKKNGGRVHSEDVRPPYLRVVYPIFFCGYFLKKPCHLSRSTPKSASPKMDEFILDVPSTRLTKTMGTSTILNPQRWAVYYISI